MFGLLYPQRIVDSIYEIDLGELYNNNIRGIILDIDNTLVGHGADADDKVLELIEKAKNAGIQSCIVSNNSESRVVKFNENLKIPAIHRASKPRRRAFIKGAQIMNLPVNQVAVIGDQVFTDILGGNRIGMMTILVKPIGKDEPYFIKLKRVLEWIVLKRYSKK